MKNRVKNTTFTVLIVLAGIGLCYVLYYVFDYMLNGFFVSWFEENFLYTDYTYNEFMNTELVMRRIRWKDLKTFCFQVLVIIVVICVLAVRISVTVRCEKIARERAAELGGMVREYWNGDKEAGEIFPKEYSELSLQLAEQKVTVQRHEQLLKEEAGRKNDLITCLAHDLKTPLTSVIGYLSLLQEAPDMPEKQKAKYVGITLEKALRLELLINEFFEITRYNLQQIALEQETIDLCYMLVQLADEFYPILTEHGNTISLDVPEGTSIYGDAVKLARVFNNILKNAVAYSYEGTPILVKAGQWGGYTEISFSNQGKTIPRQKLDMIFEKFFRLDEARTANTGGAGLGLFIAREIVTLHGGTITAQSENEVTIFKVSIPSCS